MGSSGPPGSGDWLLWCRGLTLLLVGCAQMMQWETTKLQVWDLLWFQPECRCSNIALTSKKGGSFSVAQNDDGDFF